MTIILVCFALIPAVALGFYVFKKDRVDKEPFGLLALLFVLGCVICFPASEIESVLTLIIDEIFSPFITFTQEGASGGTIGFRLYTAVYYFVGVALVEEGLKWIVLLLITRKNKNFNSLFDGVIYAAFVSLGFAALENVLYAFSYGLQTTLMRAVTAVPGHMFFSVFMGYYYSMWHMYARAKSYEKQLKAFGHVPSNSQEFSTGRFLLMSILVPVLIHGFYDYCLSVNSMLEFVSFIFFLGFLYVYCFSKVKKTSVADADDHTYSSILIVKKYPHLLGLFFPSTEINQMQPTYYATTQGTVEQNNINN